MPCLILAAQLASNEEGRSSFICLTTANRAPRAAAAVPRHSYAAAPLPETEIPRSQPPSLSLMPPIACTSDFETTHEHVPAYDDLSNSAHSAAVTSPRRGRIGGARSLALLDSATSAIRTIQWSSTTQPRAPVDGIRRGWQRRTPPIAPVKLDFRPPNQLWFHGKVAEVDGWAASDPVTPYRDGTVDRGATDSAGASASPPFAARWFIRG
jgi:hypothetical protein